MRRLLMIRSGGGYLLTRGSECHDDVKLSHHVRSVPNDVKSVSTYYNVESRASVDVFLRPL